MGLNEALAQQPVVNRHDGRAGDVETLGELAGGGQAFTGMKPSVEDRGAELPIDLPRSVSTADEADLDVDWHGWRCRNWLSHQSITHRTVEP